MPGPVNDPAPPATVSGETQGTTAEPSPADRADLPNAKEGRGGGDPTLPLPAVATVPPWRAGLLAARANVVPGVVLSFFAVGLLLAYWYLPAAGAVLERVGEWKVAGGFAFSAVSTAIFGGVLPGLVQRVRPTLRHTMPWRHLLFLTAFWAYKGVEVDLLYRLQAMWFGGGHDLATLVKKVVVDQGVYVPLLAVPPTVLAYAFKDADLSLRRTLEPIRRQGLRGWLYRVALPVGLSNWGVWIPAVIVVYCLPLPLQLPMQNLVLCFWSLLLVLQVGPTDQENDAAN